MALLEARVPEPLAQSVDALAKASGESKSEILRCLLIRGLREMAAPPTPQPTDR